MRQLKYFFTVGLLLCFLSGNSQPVYQIPGALVQPQFVFPIFFEDATGERDTLYLGYDSLSSGTGVYGLGNDDVWGVKMVHVDTGSFHAFWEQQNGDSVYKVNVSIQSGRMEIFYRVYMMRF